MTMKSFVVPAIAALTLGLAGAAMAQEVDAVIDTNADGMYSFPELTVAYPAMTAEVFGVMDTTGDGLLDAVEVAARVAAGTIVPLAQ